MKNKTLKTRAKQSKPSAIAGRKKAIFRAPRAARIVKLGNGRGIRLPQAVVDESGLPDKIEMLVQNGRIILQAPGYDPHADWDEAFAKAIREHGPIPKLTDVERAFLDMPNDFDDKDWTW